MRRKAWFNTNPGQTTSYSYLKYKSKLQYYSFWCHLHICAYIYLNYKCLFFCTRKQHIKVVIHVFTEDGMLHCLVISQKDPDRSSRNLSPTCPSPYTAKQTCKNGHIDVVVQLDTVLHLVNLVQPICAYIYINMIYVYIYIH